MFHLKQSKKALIVCIREVCTIACRHRKRVLKTLGLQLQALLSCLSECWMLNWVQLLLFIPKKFTSVTETAPCCCQPSAKPSVRKICRESDRERGKVEWTYLFQNHALDFLLSIGIKCLKAVSFSSTTTTVGCSSCLYSLWMWINFFRFL